VQHWLTRKRIVWLGIGAIVVLLLADGFVAAPAHDVRTPGATPLAAALVKSDTRILFQAVQPSESISDIRCQLWHRLHDPLSCPGDVASTYFPSITQTASTLYVPWTGCISWSGSGAIVNWQGFNLEYMASGRRLVIHCFVAEPWITHHETLFGVAALPSISLLVVPTSAMGRGTVEIVEEDRLEHLVGDQSTEFQLATATIS
jgi:hypothetical protein